MIKILTVGHACLDIVHTVPRIPRANTKIASKAVDIRIGGNAANAAVAVCDLGGKADLCTVLGSEYHPFTRILTGLLGSKQIGTKHCRYDQDEPCPNSTIMVLPDGDRAIVNWQADSIRSGIAIPSSIGEYSMVMADSYRLPMVREVFAMAKAAGIPTMLDVDGVVDDVTTLPDADHIWFSQESWRKQQIPLGALQARFGGVVGITDGDRAVSYTTKSDGTVHLYQPPHVRAINTLGAGDVFRARLGLGIVIGESLEMAVVNACATAGDHVIGKPLTRIFP